MHSVPSEADWSPRHEDDLDAADAHEMFAGKTNEQAQGLFFENAIQRTNDLRWMPPVPFRYYVFGFRDHVMGGNFGFLESPDASSCFLGLIEEKLEHHPDHILPVIDALWPAIEHVGSNQALYEADVAIYGDFKETVSRITSLRVRLQQQPASP